MTIDPTDFEHVRAQRERDRRDATIYSLEALGYSHAEAIANYVRAIDTRSESPSSPEVPADD